MRGNPPLSWVQELATREVNAAIEDALEGGATTVVVNENHSSRHLIEELDPRAQLIRGGWKPDQTMEGIDETFDALFVLSMHAKRGTPHAVFAHTWSLGIYDYRVNGVSIGELGMAVYFAASLGVPTALVSGDMAACEEAKALLGDVELVPTKEGITWISAKCPHPSQVLQRIHDAAKRAIERLDDFKPVQLSSPVTVEIEMVSPNMIPWWLWVPTVEPNGPCGVKFQAPDYRAAHRLFLVLSKLELAYHQETGLYY